MKIVPLTQERAEEARAFLNYVFVKDDLVYQPLSEETFETGFLKSLPQAVRSTCLLCDDSDRIAGLAGGVAMTVTGKTYITFVAVEPSLRRRGWGTKLLTALEENLISCQGSRKLKIECVFFNPVNLTWTVPGTKDRDHPNAPGVDVSTVGYLFMKNCGYRDYVVQNSYYLPLDKYEYPQEIRERAERLAEQGIEIVKYDPEKHTGLNELFDALGSEDWRQTVLENVHRPDGGDPVLVVVRGGRVMGFTGPLAVQPSGRGYFCGIGVHPDTRGLGAGKVLFAALCRGLKELGAGYMTLFTGETNPARNIYEAAGFKIVKVWADMRKEV